MCSGIGPAEVLKKAKIPVVIENEHVGRNMYDVRIYSIILVAMVANYDFPIMLAFNDVLYLPCQGII